MSGASLMCYNYQQYPLKEETRMQFAKRVVRHSWWLILALLAVSLVANAYTMLDKGVVTVVLPPGWKMKSIGRHDGVIATNYEKVIDKDTSENLAEIQVVKDPNKPAATMVKEMGDRIHDEVILEHCKPEDVKQLSVPENAFSVWMQQIECKDSQSGIIQLYLDADPKAMYLFTYTIPGYPFTAAARSAAVDILSSSIQVCYKGKPCYPFHSVPLQ
jgi:hypothetical protein